MNSTAPASVMVFTVADRGGNDVGVINSPITVSALAGVWSGGTGGIDLGDRAET